MLHWLYRWLVPDRALRGLFHTLPPPPPPRYMRVAMTISGTAERMSEPLVMLQESYGGAVWRDVRRLVPARSQQAFEAGKEAGLKAAAYMAEHPLTALAHVIPEEWKDHQAEWRRGFSEGLMADFREMLETLKSQGANDAGPK